LILWHGCTAADQAAIVKSGVDPLQVDPIGEVIYNRGVDVAASAINELLKSSREG
jgi:hypothetical protein